MRRVLVLGALLAVGCDRGQPIETDDTAAVPVLEGPRITHTPPDGRWLEGDPIAFEATAEDEDGVEGIQLFYRRTGDLPFFQQVLDPVEVETEDGPQTVWQGLLDGTDVRAPGVEYYLRAFDRSDFRVPADFPPEGRDLPIALPVSVVPLEVPYSQGFDDTETNFGVYEVGWTEHALGFRGERWNVWRGFGVSGGAAVHAEGYTGIQPVDDWLVTPTLDFTGLESAEVRFLQYGQRVSHLEAHELWLSTGSADPASGDFVKVADLPAPTEGAWVAAPVVDLSAWVGSPAVTLAWRYQGGFTDLWALDDVRVRLFGPDLQLVSVDVPRLDPGEAAVLDVTLMNVGAPMGGPVQLSGDADPDRVRFPDRPLLPALNTGESVTAQLPVEIRPNHPDNTVTPAILAATDGTDGGTWPVDLLVGDPTRGIVRVHTLGSGYLRIWMGTGNPAQPHAEEVVFQGNVPAGVHTFEVDLSDHLQYLPSVPGRLRWWTRIDGAAEASLLGFGIDYDGAVTWSTDGGPYPATTPTLFYLPERADPVFAGGSHDPDPLVPGADAMLQVTLRNDGGATVGVTRVRFGTSSPDLVLRAFDAPLSGAAGWPAGAETTVEVPIAIAPGHTDSTPLPLVLTVADSIEVFQVPVDVPVPWPDLGFGTGRFNDPGGNGNGILDPGESAVLFVNVRNDGQLAAQTVGCQLVQTGGPAMTLGNASAGFTEIGPGETSEASFAITAGNGAVGDAIDFRLTCTTDQGSWATDLAYILGGVGWNPLPVDPAGDALPGAPADLRDGRWRVDGDVLSIEVTSTAPLDPATLAMELWAFSAGSTWTNHVVTLQSGTAELYGIRFGGFNFLADVQVTFVGTDTVRLELPIPDMELTVNELAFGVGAGFCATPDLYCDHYPDGWGNPYAGGPVTTVWHLATW